MSDFNRSAEHEALISLARSVAERLRLPTALSHEERYKLARSIELQLPRPILNCRCDAAWNLVMEERDSPSEGQDS